MEGIVLAGGFGSRLRPVVADLPKVMAPINGRPFLELVLDNLQRSGFTRITLSLGYLPEPIVQHFGPSFRGMELSYQIEDEPLGTGGAVRQALAHCLADSVFVFNGDTYLELEAAAVAALSQQTGSPVIVARQVPDTSRFGRLEITDGTVRRFAEKGVSGPGLINAGCYLFPRDLLDGFALGKPFALEQDFLVEAVPRIRFAAFETHGRFIDIGIPEDYARAQREFAPFGP